jgi:ABC-type glutathione transport system ATPase component
MIRHLGSSLTDVTYVFDEPTIGLHPHDIKQMNDLLLLLRDKGNTVLVVEHKPETITIAEHVVDLGPGAGAEGGTVCFEAHPPTSPPPAPPSSASTSLPTSAPDRGPRGQRETSSLVSLNSSYSSPITYIMSPCSGALTDHVCPPSQAPSWGLPCSHTDRALARSCFSARRMRSSFHGRRRSPVEKASAFRPMSPSPGAP